MITTGKITNMFNNVIKNLYTKRKINIINQPIKDTVVFGTSAVNNIPTSSQAIQNFIDTFLKQNDLTDKIILGFDFRKYKRGGIPLSYPRGKYKKDILRTIKHLTEDEQKEVLQVFQLRMEKDLEGIGFIPKKLEHPILIKLAKIIKKFTIDNRCTLRNSQARNFFDTIIKGCPEFATSIGKVQHGTHVYDVSGHTFVNLQNMLKNPHYAQLSDRNKAVAKMAMLLHDLGKRGLVIDKGHFVQSAKYARDILPKYDSYFTQSEQERIIKLINNHHWFEKFHTRVSTPQEVIDIFKTEKDIEIAKILAKADIEGVAPGFNIEKMNFRNQEEYEIGIAKLMEELHVPKQPKTGIDM